MAMRAPVGLVALGFIVVVLHGQVSSRLQGIVQDASGNAVAGAAVQAVNASTGLRTSVRTKRRGEYAFPSLFPGSYDVSAEAPGFKSVVLRGVVVRTGAVAEQDFRLEPGVTTGRISRDAEAETVKRDQGLERSGRFLLTGGAWR